MMLFLHPTGCRNQPLLVEPQVWKTAHMREMGAIKVVMKAMTTRPENGLLVRDPSNQATERIRRMFKMRLVVIMAYPRAKSAALEIGNQINLYRIISASHKQWIHPHIWHARASRRPLSAARHLSQDCKGKPT
jgi:hypothetical protein